MTYQELRGMPDAGSALEVGDTVAVMWWDEPVYYIGQVEMSAGCLGVHLNLVEDSKNDDDDWEFYSLDLADHVVKLK